MPGSKAYSQRYRKVLADPRAASSFDLRWKELVYPIVSDRAMGSRIWDIDGNSYVDVANLASVRLTIPGDDEPMSIPVAAGNDLGRAVCGPGRLVMSYPFHGVDP